MDKKYEALGKTFLRFLGTLFIMGAVALNVPEYRVILAIIGFCLYWVKDAFITK